MEKISWLKIIAGVLLAVLFISGCTGDVDELKKVITPEERTPLPTLQQTEKPHTLEVTPSSIEEKTTAPESVTEVRETQTTEVIISGGGSSTSVKQKKPAEKTAEKTTKGYFQLLISDKPADISDFMHLYVSFSHARIFKAEEPYGYGYYDHEGGFEEIDIDATVDLTELVGENALPVLETQLEEGKYTKIELYVKSVEGQLWDRYGYGYGYSLASVKVPSNKLKIVKLFEIKSGEETKFVFDINVVKKGNKDEYNLIPVISKSGVVGKDLKESEVKIIKK